MSAKGWREEGSRWDEMNNRIHQRSEEWRLEVEELKKSFFSTNPTNVANYSLNASNNPNNSKNTINSSTNSNGSLNLPNMFVGKVNNQTNPKHSNTRNHTSRNSNYNSQLFLLSKHNTTHNIFPTNRSSSFSPSSLEEPSITPSDHISSPIQSPILSSPTLSSCSSSSFKPTFSYDENSTVYEIPVFDNREEDNDNIEYLKNKEYTNNVLNNNNHNFNNNSHPPIKLSLSSFSSSSSSIPSPSTLSPNQIIISNQTTPTNPPPFHHDFDIGTFDPREVLVSVNKNKLTLMACHLANEGTRQTRRETKREVDLPESVDVSLLRCCFPGDGRLVVFVEGVVEKDVASFSEQNSTQQKVEKLQVEQQKVLQQQFRPQNVEKNNFDSQHLTMQHHIQQKLKNEALQKQKSTNQLSAHNPSNPSQYHQLSRQQYLHSKTHSNYNTHTTNIPSNNNNNTHSNNNNTQTTNSSNQSLNNNNLLEYGDNSSNNNNNINNNNNNNKISKDCNQNSFDHGNNYMRSEGESLSAKLETDQSHVSDNTKRNHFHNNEDNHNNNIFNFNNLNIVDKENNYTDDRTNNNNDNNISSNTTNNSHLNKINNKLQTNLPNNNPHNNIQHNNTSTRNHIYVYPVLQQLNKNTYPNKISNEFNNKCITNNNNNEETVYKLTETDPTKDSTTFQDYNHVIDKWSNKNKTCLPDVVENLCVDNDQHDNNNKHLNNNNNNENKINSNNDDPTNENSRVHGGCTEHHQETRINYKPSSSSSSSSSPSSSSSSSSTASSTSLSSSSSSSLSSSSFYSPNLYDNTNRTNVTCIADDNSKDDNENKINEDNNIYKNATNNINDYSGKERREMRIIEEEISEGDAKTNSNPPTNPSTTPPNIKTPTITNPTTTTTPTTSPTTTPTTPTTNHHLTITTRPLNTALMVGAGVEPGYLRIDAIEDILIVNVLAPHHHTTFTITLPKELDPATISAHLTEEGTLILEENE